MNSSSAYLGINTNDLTSPNLAHSRRSSSWSPNEGMPHTKRCWDSLFTVYTCRGHSLQLVCQGMYLAESNFIGHSLYELWIGNKIFHLSVYYVFQLLRTWFFLVWEITTHPVTIITWSKLQPNRTTTSVKPGNDS